MPPSHALPRLLPALLLLVAGCNHADPNEYKDRLRSYLTERCYAHGLKVKLTDKDNRAAPPTRYTDASSGVVYTIRHHLESDDGRPATLVTWVYRDQKAMEAARPAWDEIVRETKGSEARVVYLDSFSTPELSMIMMGDSLNVGLDSVFPTMGREIKTGLSTALTARPQ